MEENWLTVGSVTDIQYAVQANRAVRSKIESLQGATLPALIEYKCLVWSRTVVLPPLPPTIEHSDLGIALASLEMRIRAGCQARPTDMPTLQGHSAEFTLLSHKEQLLCDPWALFEARLNRSATMAGFSRPISDLLQGALHEMAENSLLHSNSSFPVIVGYHALNGFIQFCVADIGIGVLGSLRTCGDYSGLKTHAEAIRNALHDGVTRFGRQRGGFGFRPVFKAVVSEWGLLRFRSGEGCITIDGKGCDADSGKESSLPFLPGFQVTVSCRTDPAIPSTPLL
jgi:anti-sigma regulatory factor (Ser/Thr protein kinase)